MAQETTSVAVPALRSLETLRPRHPHAVRALSQALMSGRLHHAYLFLGREQRHLQELSLAMVATLVCERAASQGGVACLECRACRKLQSGNHPDVLWLQPSGDNSTIGVREVRETCAALALAPLEASRKVVLVNGAERMGSAAQNALLKTLEEPPGSGCFLLWTTQRKALLATIRSRCQRLYLAPPGPEEAQRVLEDDGGIASNVARLLAALVGGDVDRAQQLAELGVEQIWAELGATLQPEADTMLLLQTAATLGADRDRYELTLAMLEVHIRDVLAHASRSAWNSGANDAPDSDYIRRHVAAAARLAGLRRQQAYHPNRTLALEALLLMLTGRSPLPPELSSASSLSWGSPS